MSTNAKYRVLPHEPNYQLVALSSYDKSSTRGLGGWGCLVWAVVFFACYFFIGIVGLALTGYDRNSADFVIIFAIFLAIAIASVGVAVLSSGIRRNKLKELEHKRNEQSRENEIQRVTNEANSLTSTVARQYESSTKIANELPVHLERATGWLQRAEREYTENAFGPFWDAVENAALHLSLFNDKAKQLSTLAGEYYRSLNGRHHTFPTFPIQASGVPDASITVNEMRRVIRMGHTNFQFANIWEHRRTREVLIAGFHTLGEAINNIGSVIDSSIFSLHQSISSDTARLVEEQITTRESLDSRLMDQNRMLDNIQH